VGEESRHWASRVSLAGDARAESSLACTCHFCPWEKILSVDHSGSKFSIRRIHMFTPGNREKSGLETQDKQIGVY
jgi:hypothetical protein